jgi:homoserine kinase
MTDQTDQPNEIVADAREKAAQKQRLKKAVPIAVGIGSAALAAALLYANRNRKD